MSQPQPPVRPRRSRLTPALAALTVLVPVAFAVAWPLLPQRNSPVPVRVSPVSHFPPAALAFERRTLGREPGHRPRITGVQIVDLDRDGRNDVLVSDAMLNRVFWYRARAGGGWDEVPLGDEVNRPAGLAAADLDGDGDLDVVVTVLGDVLPTDDRVGRVVWLENTGGSFANRVLLDHVRRVSDVQAGDLDGDGDADLAAAVFGYQHGEVLWLENRGGGKFRDHLLLATQGPSHVPLADFDGDGRLDVAALVSQEHEEVWLFRNAGKGDFDARRVFESPNFDLGGAALTTADLDRDGKPDLLLAAGDNLEVNHHYPQPWHGCYWLRNSGGGSFEAKRVGAVGGAYAAAAEDFDGDGDTDVALACMFNDWYRTGAASLVLLENDGRQEFTAKTIADRPTHLAVLATGDLDGDGRPDLVAGSMHLNSPAPERAGRVTLWLSRKAGAP